MLTITTDNGTEFMQHEKIVKALDSTVYFADSYCFWQKEAIENTNKLIRQYLPKERISMLLVTATSKNPVQDKSKTP